MGLAGMALFLAVLPLVPGQRAVASDPAEVLELIRRRQGDALHNLLQTFTGNLDGARDPSGFSALHLAIQRWNHEATLLLLLKGVDPDVRDAAGRTPLFDAVGHPGELGLLHAELLALRGADSSAQASDGSTPLAVAASTGNVELAEFLIWLGARPDPPGIAADRSPRSIARAAGHTNVTALIESAMRTPPITIHTIPRSIPPFVQQAFVRAARQGDFKTLEDLLASGADINGRNPAGETALLRAVLSMEPDVVSFLLLLGADPNIPDNEGISPLFATIGWHGVFAERMRSMLLLKGADVNAIRKDGHSILTYAAYCGNVTMAKWAIRLGADAVRATPKGTPMRVASQRGHRRVIDLLQQSGVTEPPSTPDYPGWELIHAIVAGDAAEVVRLLDSGVSPNTIDDKGNSALMKAVWELKCDIANTLIDRGADIQYQNPRTGWTPLFWTIVWATDGMTKLRQSLLDLGANPNVSDKNGMTPLMRSCMYGHEVFDGLRQLAEAGAAMNARDTKGRTALGYALEKGNAAAAEFLRARGALE